MGSPTRNFIAQVHRKLESRIPIIGWPLGGEQCFNSQMLENEVGVCVEVARGVNSQTKHNEIARVNKMVLGKTEKGEEMRRKCATFFVSWVNIISTSRE
ncbi:udp-glycosyltransferase 92a1 [Quercus suber]|uniref:Udp-glycosyltransferase 92a1 n=1 Tax=Quercus suber TaxID=58331 RepID=A0AAW0L9P2_QUESU